MQRIFSVPILALLLVAGSTITATSAGEKKKDDGYVAIFDGKTLDGWHVSAKSGHSGKSKNKSGGKWIVADGAVTGTQDYRVLVWAMPPRDEVDHVLEATLTLKAYFPERGCSVDQWWQENEADLRRRAKQLPR